ncbi:MAG: nucleotidyltransferase domain-containing protein [Deltaproteobacteria bacterium]|nr:nucleotidyltransferase domain-containing protein [Deltaproteobacteria bacterium]
MKHPDLKLLVNVFKKYPEIQAVYLFGSTAAGNVHQQSDLDLAIIPRTKALREQKLTILSDLARHGFCDVAPVFLDSDDIVLQYEAVRQNIVVYQTPGFERGTTYSRIVRQYLDFYPYLSVQRQAYKKRILHGKS